MIEVIFNAQLAARQTPGIFEDLSLIAAPRRNTNQRISKKGYGWMLTRVSIRDIKMQMPQSSNSYLASTLLKACNSAIVGIS
jgi:hypothetical protein